MRLKPCTPVLVALVFLLLAIGLSAVPARHVYAEPAVTTDLALLEPETAPIVRLLGSSGDGRFGVPVAGGADVDGDGHEDFAMAAMLADPLGRADAGEVYLVFGDGTFGRQLDTSVDDRNILRIAGGGRQENAGAEIWLDDVTGDGIGDVLIGRQNHRPESVRPGAGAVSIVVGGPALRELAQQSVTLDLRAPSSTVRVAQLVGEAAVSRLGVWVRAADVDGDGVADVIAGADQTNAAGAAHAGAVWVALGGPGLADLGTYDLGSFGAAAASTGIARVIPGPGAGEFHFGSTCHGGDLDGNGRAELFASAALQRIGASLPAEGVSSSSTHAVGGTARGSLFVIWDDNFPQQPWPAGLTIDLAAAPGAVTRIDGGSDHRTFGEEVIGGSDFDADGRADLFVGDLLGDASAARDRPGSGAGLVMFGAADLRGLHTDADAIRALLPTTKLIGHGAGDISSDTVMVGDFDGDDIDDLAVAAPHNRALGRSDAGAVYVLFGRRGGWPDSLDFDVLAFPSSREVRTAVIFGARGGVGSDAGDTLAYSGTAADIDGDGVSDLVINEMLGNGRGNSGVDRGNALAMPGQLFSRRLPGARCPDGPLVGCVASTSGEVRLRRGVRRAQDRASWRMQVARTVADWAPGEDPALVVGACFYDGETGALVGGVHAAGAGDCDGGPCWRVTARRRAYRDRYGAADGLTRLVDRETGGDVHRVRGRADGGGLRLTRGTMPTRLVAQLRVDNGIPLIPLWCAASELTLDVTLTGQRFVYR